VKMARMRSEAAALECHLRAEADLERNRLRDLFRQAPAAMALLNGPKHEFVFVNDAYVKSIGKSKSCVRRGRGIRGGSSGPSSVGWTKQSRWFRKCEISCLGLGGGKIRCWYFPLRGFCPSKGVAFSAKL
jgi:hypothetical protein